MEQGLIRRARRVVSFIWLVLLTLLIGLSVLTNLAPLTGHQLFIITGGSMEPAIPVGSLVVASRTDATKVAVGDLVTVRADNGVVVTHRVTRVADLPDGRFFETRGDANPSPDASLVPARAILGAVDGYVPYAGFAQLFLSTTPGMIAALAVLGAIGLLYILLGMLGSGAHAVGARAPIGT
jgi:signal peptidase I